MTSQKRTSKRHDAVSTFVDQIADAVRDAPADGSHINVARRTNIKVAANVGQEGRTTRASATQVASITQDGHEKSE